MSNKIIIGLVILAVAAGIVYFATTKKPATNQNEAQQQTNQAGSQQEQQTNPAGTSSQQQPASQKNTLAGLLTGSAQKCTYADGENTGTVYTANGKLRTDISGISEGVRTSSHAIIDSNTYYAWVDGQPQGMKFPFSQSAAGSAGNTQNVDVNKQVDYNCSGWSVDNSMFVAPSNVEFMDLSDLQTQ